MAPESSASAPSAARENARLQEPQGLAPDSTSQGQLGLVKDLQEALADGTITQDQYNEGLGALYEGHASALQQELDAESANSGDPEAEAEGGEGAADMGGPSSPPEGVQFASPEDDPLQKMSADQALLARSTDRPNESLLAGSGESRRNSVPPDVLRALPELIEASKDPNAPPGIQVLLNLIDYHMNKQPQMRRSLAEE